MTGWTRHEGTAVVLDLENVDTDQIIPARFMSTPRSEGYGRFLLHDMAREADGTLRPDFPLTRAPEASVLITRRNFGTGSSREAAVYALVDAGFRAVIAPSFGDIFSANAVNNGLLPARVSEEDIDILIGSLGNRTAPATVDLDAATVTVGPLLLDVSLDPVWQEKLINGWDDIDLTRAHGPAIARFRETRAVAQPWAFPQA